MLDGKVVNASTLLVLCEWADRTEQNRRAETERLAVALDPDGWNVLSRVLAFHNDQPVDRVEVYAKVIGSMEPARFFLDVPHDTYESLPALARDE
jgi:hypothetical protein